MNSMFCRKTIQIFFRIIYGQNKGIKPNFSVYAISLIAACAATDIARKSIGLQQLLYLPVEIRGDFLGLVEHIVFPGSFLGGGLRGNATLAA